MHLIAKVHLLDSALPFLIDSIPSAISNTLIMCHFVTVIKLCINFLWDKMKQSHF